jgi:hypothetical protein
MKKTATLFSILTIISACRHSDKAIINPGYIDSLITYYSPSPQSRANSSDIDFWGKRIDSLPDNFVNGPQYAAALSLRFHLYGDIRDLIKSDSLVRQSNEANREKEPGIFRSLASLAMLRHQFIEADSFLQRAIRIEGSGLPNVFTGFDIAFERGDYRKAAALLSSLSKGNSYGYLFRRSKYEHYDGSLDTAIACMKKAADKASNSNYLKQAALSNAADLCIHKGLLREASDLYKQSITIDAADFHSIAGLGWIALVHDKNDSLATAIFRFVQKHQRSPDVLLKLEQAAEVADDRLLQRKYAFEFAQQAGDSIYGHMYSKYLIDLYTGILDDPAKAVELAKQETISRPTPQVFAWYAWSLFCNNEQSTAYNIFKQLVSGKPLEGLELYYMGKMMLGMNKRYNAQEFFKAAYKNRYDLSPARQEELERILE